MRLIELSILFESRIDNIIKSRGDKIVAYVKKTERKDMSAEDIVNLLAEADPTSQSKNVQWIVNQYLKGQFKLEDTPSIHDDLKQFFEIQQKLEKRDLNQYTYREMSDVVDKEFNQADVSDNHNHEDFGPEVNVMYHGPLGTLLVPKTMEAAQKYSSGTKWCTAYTNPEKNMFHHYSADGPLYIWRDKSGDKFQFHFPHPDEREDDHHDDDDDYFEDDEMEYGPDAEREYQWMDAQDVPLEPDKIAQFRKHPVIGKLFAAEEKDIIHDPDRIMVYATALGGRWPEAEKVIARTPRIAATYARESIKGRWPEGEAAISRDPHAALDYACAVLRKRWPEAEPIIMQNPMLAVVYANRVIKGRWPEAEEIIMTQPEQAVTYAQQVIKGRWPEAEEIIANHHWAGQVYAEKIIKGRWSPIEKTILKSPRLVYDYARTHGRWPEGEHVILTSATFTLMYAQNILKKPWPPELAAKAEAILKSDRRWNEYRDWVEVMSNPNN